MVNDDRLNILEELRTKELVKQDELRNVGSIIRPQSQSCIILSALVEPPGGIIRCDSIDKFGYLANWKCNRNNLDNTVRRTGISYLKPRRPFFPF